jgi:hypothetical protein
MNNSFANLSRISLVAVALTLVACSGKSKVGEQDNLSPTAVANAVGYGAPGGDGNLTAAVRAQSEITLTGKESIDADKPIISFLWEPANAAAQGVPITVRNSSTINVSVPAVAAATDLQFRLTVTDSDGDQDTALATLQVQPVHDVGEFLNLINETAKLRLVAGTPQPTAGGQFRLELRAYLTYPTRASTANNLVFNTINYPIGTAITGEWLTSTQAGDAGAADLRNPLFVLPLPEINLDEVTRQFQLTLPSSAPSMPDPAFVDSATVEVRATLTPITATANLSLYAVDATGAVVAPATNGGTGAPVTLSLSNTQIEGLRLSGGGRENRATADAYYAGIDPTNSKLTLTQWLTENCFNPAAADKGAEVHAVYVNNYDLGFGRDMYARVSRPAGCTSTSFEPGDAAAVVINHATLEGAAKKVDAFIAVAMEYEASDPTHAQNGIVSFYIYAPDEGTGEMRRIKSANFDGRGEKVLPGACTACHGGRTPNPTEVLNNNAYGQPGGTQIGATFMPWDLDSFLFADTDPTFPTDASNAALRTQYSRANQQAAFKQLNTLALYTYGSGVGNQFTCHANYTGPCEMVQGWYGGTNLPSGTFVSNYVQPGWRSTVSGNPTNVETLYHNVFARHCRGCHVQRGAFPESNVKDPSFETYAQFVQNASPNYRSLLEEHVFQTGRMPLARLTMDRLWQPGPNNAPSAGAQLATHLGLPAGTRPGAAIVCAQSLGNTPPLSESAGARTEVPRGNIATNANSLSLSGECSRFVRSYNWSLTRPGGSAAVLSGTANNRTAFVPDRPGDYDLTLNVTGVSGGTASLTRYATVRNLLPVAVDMGDDIAVGTSQAFDVLAAASSLGDGSATVRIDSTSGSGFTASIDGSNRIAISPTTLAGGSVNFSILDVDGDADAGVITFTVTATITAADNTVGPFTVNSSGNPVNLTSLVSAQGQPVTITIVGNGSTGQGGTASTYSCTGSVCASYAPPGAYMSEFGAGATAMSPRDTFTYRACFQLQPAVCDTGLVTLRVRGTTSFTSVYNFIMDDANVGCTSGCHAAAQNGAAWDIANGATEKTAFCMLRFNANTNNTKVGSEASGAYPGDSGWAIVSSGSATNSLLYRKPRGAGGISHGGGSIFASDSEMTAIINWINEGAYFTSAANQSCAP